MLTVLKLRKWLLTGSAVVGAWGQASALTVSLDYSHASFFTGNATAQSTLEKAASDVSWAITTALGSLSQDMYTNTASGGSTANADFTVYYTNPETNAEETLNSFSFASNEFRIYVGGRNLSGSTLGQGGPGSTGISGGGSATTKSDFDDALSGLASITDPAMTRGGPVLSTRTLNFDFGASGVSSQNFQTGYTVGNLWFDTDTNNNDVTDSASEIAASWHLDYSTAVEAGKNDLYSVAVHEMLHTVGFGIGDTWDALVSGTDWLGAEVIAKLGSGTDAVDSGGAHIASGLTGTPIVDGVLAIGSTQEAVMDPTLTTGTRKYITDLDLAFLADMGWSVASPVPEPQYYALLFGMFAILLARKRRKV